MLRRMRIRSKLIAIVVAPIAALMVLAGTGVRARFDDGQKANQVRRLATLADQVRPVAQRLADERAVSVQFLVAKDETTPAALAAARTQVDQAVGRLHVALKKAGTIPAKLGEHLKMADSDLLVVSQTRGQLDAGAVNTDHVVQNYSSTVGHLLDFIDEFGNIPEISDTALTRTTQAAAEIGVAREGYAVQRDLLVSALAAGSLNIEQFGALRARQQQVDDQTRRFMHDAAPAAGLAMQNMEQKESMVPATDIEKAAANAGPYAPLAGSPIEYAKVATERTTALATIENQASSAVVKAAAAKVASSRAAERNYLAIILATLAVALGLAVIVARSLVRPIRELTRAAVDSAEIHLPQLVEAMHSSEALSGSNDDLALPAIPVRSRDEIGELAQAFNAVQDVTFRTAIEQVALRRSVGDMFVNLGRRSQTLIDRQLELIDSLETAERDPDALNDLFALDHLATRMRRNAENLLVLAGEEAPRKWGQAIPLVDVIRAAVSEVEDYPRVDVIAQDELFLAGHAASDIAHLLAELIENATSFSAPTTRVRVRVEKAGDRYLVSVVDQGIGISDGDLVKVNERLGNPPDADLSLGNRIGFFVIGRLAKRTGTAVRLGRSSSGGVIAQLALPPTLVTSSPAELLSPSSMPTGPLLDSPQSARDRLLGALSSQTGSPDAATGPTGPAVRNGSPAPTVNGHGPHVSADLPTRGTSTASSPGTDAELPQRRNGRSGRPQPSLDLNGHAPTEPTVEPVEAAPEVANGDAPLPTRRSARAAEPTAAAGENRRDLGAFFGASSGVARDAATDDALVPAPPAPDAPTISVPSAPPAGQWAAPASAPPAAAPHAAAPPAPLVPAPQPAPIAVAASLAPTPEPVAIAEAAPLPMRHVPPSPAAGVPPAPTFSPAPGGFGTPGGPVGAEHKGLDERLAASSGLSSLLGQGRTTAAGLPQRAAGASRRAVPPPLTPEEAAAANGRTVRSADDVRSMLARFRDGVERGRHLPDPTAARSTED